MEFTGDSDIHEQIVQRYSKSFAPQHRHLCKTATAIHSTMEYESRPFTPLSYFTTVIEALSDTSTAHDADAVCGLSSFLEILLPLITEKPIDMSKASDAAKVLVALIDCPCEGLLVPSVRALVDCLGVLLEYCNLADWESVQLGFETLMKYSIHKQPKVRKCAQSWVVNVFQFFQSSVEKSASKMVLKCLKTYMSLVDGSRSADVDKLSRHEHLEVLYILDLLKILIPYFPSKFISKAIHELETCISANFSLLTMHVLDVLEEILRFFESESELTPVHTLKIANKWDKHYSLVIVSITGLLSSEAIATRASDILKEMMKRVAIFQHADSDESKESVIVRSFCHALLDVLSTKKGTLNEHCLDVISILFQELGTYSHSYMGSILVKLASFMTTSSGDVKHLEECIGSAVIGMGVDLVLDVLPISINARDLSCSNTWLIRILEEYMVESSLGFFMDMIVPLAASFEEAVEKNSANTEELHSYARDCWGLLPAFCRHPGDMDENFESLVNLLISYIKKDAFMLEDIAIALQHLMRRNTNTSFLGDDKASKSFKSWYYETYASGNIKAMSASSETLLKAFTEVFLEVSPETRAFIKDTIGCLAYLTEYSAVKVVFISSLSENANRCPILELASAFVGETGIDPTDFMCSIIEECLRDEEENCQSEAYASLDKILVGCSEFRSSKFEDLMEFLFDLKSPVDITSLKWRFSCFKSLLVQSIEISCDGENKYGSHMLNEIITALKDSKGGSQEVAKDTLLEISSHLQKTISSSKTRPYHNFITMITGHLSSDIKSCAVYALSLLMLNDLEICHVMPDLVQEILELLNDKDIQAIKAVFGLIEVLVLNLEVKDLNNILSDILLSGFLPWSSVSQHHFKSELQMTVILETMMRRCGFTTVIALVPEKYRDFVNNIWENRPSKTSSEEDDTTKTDLESTNTTPNGGPKRKTLDKHPNGGIKENDGSGGKKQKQKQS